MQTKTSESSPIGINKITPPAKHTEGWIALTLAPGKKTMGGSNYWDRDLDTDLEKLKELGTTTLVPLIEDEELVHLKIPGLVEKATARGLHVKRFPFHDAGVPKDMQRTIRFIEALCRRYTAGERLVVHCNGGLGRSGMIGACARLALGLDKDPAAAIVAIRKARGPRAIETRAQEAFIVRFYKAWQRDADSNFYKSEEENDAEADRRKGGWYGLAVGDALGAPVEFMFAEAIAKKYGRVTEMRAGGPWEKGEWTDDTELAICTAIAYADPSEGFDPDMAVANMHHWYEEGPKDIGNQTRLALSLVDEGFSGPEMGPEMLKRKPMGAGNGSLMRAAPTGLVGHPKDPRLVERSIQLSSFTHPDPRCTAACAVFNAALASLVQLGPDVDTALEAAVAAAQGLNEEVAGLVQRVLEYGEPLYADMPIGYVLLCLERAFITLRDASSFEEGLIDVVNAGGDSDTNAAVAGALLGARFGFAAIPERWLVALLGRDELDRAYGWLEKFVNYRAVFDMDMPF